MRNLIACMHTGIGTAGAYKIYGVLSDFCDGIRKLSLHRTNAGLL